MSVIYGSDQELIAGGIVLDTETTGTDHTVDRLVEIAGINIDDPETYYSRLCNPGRDIPPEAMAVHHITEQMCQLSWTPKETLEDMVSRLGHPKLCVAHNAKFDRAFIEDLTQRHWDPLWVCTYRCAMKIWPTAPRYTNQVLRYWLGLHPKLPPDLAPHRALYDIIVTREIFLAMLQLGYTLDKLLEWSNNPILLPRVFFGKHKDKTWDQVDQGYLRWVLQQSDMDEDVVFTARHYYKSRY